MQRNSRRDRYDQKPAQSLYRTSEAPSSLPVCPWPGFSLRFTSGQASRLPEGPLLAWVLLPASASLPQAWHWLCSALQTRRTPRLRVAFWEEREALPAPARSPHPGTGCRTHYSLLLTEVLCVLPGQGTVLVILRNGTEHPGTPLACAFPVLGKSQMHSACMWGEGSPERLCSSSMPCRGSEFLPKSNTSRRACSWCQLPWCPCH